MIERVVENSIHIEVAFCKVNVINEWSVFLVYCFSGFTCLSELLFSLHWVAVVYNWSGVVAGNDHWEWHLPLIKTLKMLVKYYGEVHGCKILAFVIRSFSLAIGTN